MHTPFSSISLSFSSPPRAPGSEVGSWAGGGGGGPHGACLLRARVCDGPAAGRGPKPRAAQGVRVLQALFRLRLFVPFVPAQQPISRPLPLNHSPPPHTHTPTRRAVEQFVSPFAQVPTPPPPFASTSLPHPSPRRWNKTDRHHFVRPIPAFPPSTSGKCAARAPSLFPTTAAGRHRVGGGRRQLLPARLPGLRAGRQRVFANVCVPLCAQPARAAPRARRARAPKGAPTTPPPPPKTLSKQARTIASTASPRAPLRTT